MNNSPATAGLSIENSETKKLKSLVLTGLWLIALLIIPQLIFGVLFGSFIKVEQAFDATKLNNLTGVALLLLTSLCSPLIAIPMLYKAINKKSCQDALAFLALYKIQLTVFIYYMLGTFLFWVSTIVVKNYLSIPIEPFMFNIKTYAENGYFLLLAVVSVCVVVPIMEELIFRGWLFTEIAHTKLGKVGALVITSLIFTMIHGQYNQKSTFIMLLISGFLFGLIRYKSNNISYAIAAHIIFNSLTMLSLFFTMV